jgi:hypothetical protein
MRTSAAVVCALFLAAVVGTGLAVPGVATADDGENPSQTIEIRLDAEGDAEFSVTKQFSIDDEEDREAFERLAEEFEGGNVEGALSADVFERVADEAGDEGDREMEVEDVDRETEATADAGTLELQFQWTGFADVEDDRMEVGDAFSVDGEPWLPSLSSDQRLVIYVPDGYAVESASTSVDDGALVWEGPHDFDDGEPHATLVASGQLGEGLSPLTVGLGLGFLAAVVLLAALIVQRRGGSDPWRREGGEPGGVTPVASGPEREGRNEPAGSTADPEAGSEPAGTDGDDPFGGVDPELLSDEERVVRLLEANDGRMKQADIVVETDWSNAKVSQLLSSMAEEGRIEKLRIGRENLITLVEREE